MKPVVIEKDKDGNVRITVDEIKRIVDEAYAEGYEDGKKAVTPSLPSPWMPNTTPWTQTWIDRDHITITCESLPSYLSVP